ncbi:MAG: LEA type 2 family protein [Dehalococcoidales bacterium]|nr:LEA type 2 family protein [Dehalococcoidales bacterium]
MKARSYWFQAVALLVIVVLLMGIVLPNSSCRVVKERIEMMKPEIRSITNQWGEITSATTEVITTINVYNPNPISLPVKKVASDIIMNGIKMGHAETLDLHIGREAEFPIIISTKIDNGKITGFWGSHLKRGEKSEVILDANIIFDLKVMDFTFPYQLKRPIETNLLAGLSKVGPMVVEKKAKPFIGPEITVFKIVLKSLSGSWGNVTLEKTDLNLTAIIRNDNPYALVVSKIVYNVDMNGISFASGETGTNYYFAPNSENTITTSVSLETGLMDKWFVSHIRQGERSTFNIVVSLVVELPQEIAQQLGQPRLTVDVWEDSHEFETNILQIKK